MFTKVEEMIESRNILTIVMCRDKHKINYSYFSILLYTYDYYNIIPGNRWWALQFRDQRRALKCLYSRSQITICQKNVIQINDVGIPMEKTFVLQTKL